MRWHHEVWESYSNPFHLPMVTKFSPQMFVQVSCCGEDLQSAPSTSELFLICADAAEDTCTLQWVSRFVHPPATCVHKALPAFRLFPEQTVWLLFSAGATVIAWTGVKAIFFLCFFQIPSVGKKHYSLRNLFKSMCQVLNSQASVAFCPKYFV